MIFERFYLGCLAQASYGLACPHSRKAVIVDPRRDVQIYLDWAAGNGLQISDVVLTHFHADFLAGHLELRAKTGATIHLGARAETEYPQEPLADGQALELGPGLRLVALETPGHTPEGICLLVYPSGASEPEAVLTGDTLFLGDVGRPDLMASVGFTAEELAGLLYDSLHEKLLPLPDETKVYPGHGAGSSCGKSLSDAAWTTLAEQKASNYALQPMSKEEFVAQVTAGQRPAPAYFAHDARLNRAERKTLEESLKDIRPLRVEELVRLANQGAQVLDPRDPDAYAAFHFRGSVNVGLGGKFAPWAGAVLSAERPIALVCEPGQEQEAALRLGRIGFDQVAGYLEGGPDALRGSPELGARIERISPDELHRRLASEAAPRVLDVRTCSERAESAIEGSVHVPLDELPGRLDEVSSDASWVVHCRSGYRSSIAASLLEGAGHSPVDLRGGILAWDESLSPT